MYDIMSIKKMEDVSKFKFRTASLLCKFLNFFYLSNKFTIFVKNLILKCFYYIIKIFEPKKQKIFVKNFAYIFQHFCVFDCIDLQ